MKVHVLILSLFMGQCVSKQFEFPAEKRIVSGQPANITRFPHSALLRIQKERGPSTCGGVIISRRCIMSVAHCFKHNEGIKYIRVYIGYDGYNSSRWEISNRIDIVVVHESYKPKPEKGYLNDIALIFLKVRIDFSERVRAAVLPSANDKMKFHKRLLIAGYGARSYKTRSSLLLDWIHLTLFNQKECQRIYGSAAIDPRKFCAKSIRKGESTCDGDSGSGTVVPIDDGASHLVLGLLTGSIHPCGQHRTSFHIRVIFFVHWIKKKLRWYREYLNATDPDEKDYYY